MSSSDIAKLFERASDGVLAVDAAGRVRWSNQATAELFGASLEGRLLTAFTRDADALARVLAPAGEARAQLHMTRQDSSSFRAELSAVTLAALDDERWLLIRDLDAADRRARLELELRDAKAIASAMSDNAFEAVFMHVDGVIRKANAAAERYAVVGPGGLEGQRVGDFISSDALPEIYARIAAGDERPYETMAKRATGELYPVEVHPRTIPVEFEDSQLRVVTLRDISERKALEAQLRQAQKMEAIGRLAGTIAHDFNNILTVILSSCELAAELLPDDHPSAADLAEIEDAAGRAAKLVRQLLTFGRKGARSPQLLDLGARIEAMYPMLERALGVENQLSLALGSAPAWVSVDPTQLEQVLLNLVLNARDAIETEGGRVAIELEPVELDAEALTGHPELEPGPFVELRVRDDGVGMTPETQAQVFEPFFSTKSAERGSGLGLSSVFGIIRQSGGMITVDSELGVGTCFRIRVPAARPTR